MEENTIMNEVGEQVAEAVQETVEQTAITPAQPVKPGISMKQTLIGAGLTLAGGAAGFAVDRWVLPWLNKKLEKAKTKREAKKAEKAKKKAAKENKTEANAAPATQDGVDPTTIETKVD